MMRIRRMGPQRLHTLLLALAAVLFAGCSMPQKDASMTGTHEGPAVSIGQGQARAFVTLNAQGKAQTLGVRLSEAALSGLPHLAPSSGEWEYELALPSEAAGTGYDHASVSWNPAGHTPEGVYDVPHFDFHFYAIDNAARNAITAAGEDLERAHKAPEPALMPADYVLPPGTEVPKMGAHAIDPGSAEFQHQPFTQTFLYGFYDGKVIFTEPMITLDFLQSRPNVSTPVKQPQAYDPGFDYPASYGIRYDASTRQFEITLDELARH